MNAENAIKYRSEKHADIMEFLDSAKQKSKDEIFIGLDQFLVPVMFSAKEVQDFVERQPIDKIVVLYFMDKDFAERYLSTSRIHMNDIWPNMVYVPCSISPNNKEEIEKIYEIADANKNIVFINHTVPHKTNPVMLNRYGPGHGDYLVKNDGKFSIVEGNGDAFVVMSSDMLGTNDFSNVIIIIVGVGGAGELALLAIKEQNPKRIILVDIKDKSVLANSEGADYYSNIEDVDLGNVSDTDRIIVIDATTHHNERDEKAVSYGFVKAHDSEKNVFIDYNMFINEEEYKDLITNCAIGSEYVAYTNYIMAKKIIEAAKECGVELASVSKEDFDRIVENSITVRDIIKNLLFADDNIAE